MKLNFGQDKVVVVEMNSTLTSEVSPAFIIGIVKVSKSQRVGYARFVGYGKECCLCVHHQGSKSYTEQAQYIPR